MSKSLIAGVIIGVVIIAGVAGYVLLKNQNPQGQPQFQPQAGESNQPIEGNNQTSQPEENNKGFYTGFMEVSPGAWSEIVMKDPSSGKEMHRKVVYVGKENIDGKDAQGIELSIAQGENNILAQIWLEEGKYIPVKYVVKMNSQVFCVSQSQIESYLPQNQQPSLETPEEYSPNKPNISFGTYTTPTGKTVHVAKFKSDNGGEAWVSSEVPFGFVKTLDENGNEVLYLYDFGLSGGKVEISKDELENCVSFPNIPNNIPNIPLP